METGRQLSVLLVEDNAGDARLIQELLRDHAAVRIVWVESLAAAQTHLTEAATDLVLLDLALPDSHGLDTVTEVVRKWPALPVIVLTGQNDEALGHAAISGGAEDYLVKGSIDPGMLLRSIQYAYERKRMEAALREAHELTKQIVLSVQEGIVVYDRALRHTVWNPHMQALTGVSAAEVVGRHVREVAFSGEASVLAALERALGGEVVTLPEIRHRGSNGGREGWRTANFGPLRDANGAIIGVIGNVRDITLRKEAEESLRSMSTKDELTGLHNRRGFFTLAPPFLKLADRKRRSALLLFADLDGLKTINDDLGHPAGDQAIKDVATILRRTFRASDILARLGGDEFAVLVLETPKASTEAVLARLERSLHTHNANAVRPLSLSLGIARDDWEHPSSLEDLLAQADAAMYAQKREKHNR